MADSVQMPALGESVTEGTVTRWLKQVGDRVEVDEPLLEVSTDKVDTEIPSPVAGVLQEIVVGEDETVEVGAKLAVIGEEAADGAGAPQPTGESPAPSQAAQDAPPQEQPQQAQAAPPQPVPGSAPPQRASPPAEQAPAAAGTPVTMPALGESVTEGTVTRWLKQVGEEVAVDEPLLEVSTDKVDTEIPSPVAGTVQEILVAEDETVEVGARLAIVGQGAAGGGASTPPEPAAQEQRSPQAPQQARQQSSQQSSQGAQQGQQLSAEEERQPYPGAAAVDEPTGDRGTDPEPVGAPPVQVAPADPTRQATDEAPADGPAPEEAVEDYNNPADQLSGGVRPPTGESVAPPPSEVSSYVTPLVRKLATEHAVDLATVTGTGVGGRIRKQDVLDAAQRAADERAAAEEAAAAAAREEEAARQAPPAQQAPAQQAPAPEPARAPAPAGGAGAQVAAKRGTTEKMSRLRKVIAARMVESLQVSAQLTTVVEVDVTRIARLRARAKDAFKAREGASLSFLPFFALASIEALKAFPQVNASLEGDTIVYHSQENLGVAVDTERGLLVPVIKDAGDLNIAGIARRIADLAARTRANKVTPDELGGGTFTLTNTGSRGALFDTPIINQPQVAILGTGAVVKRPVVVQDADGAESIGIRSMVYLALSYDHRLVDGADAARFLSMVKARLEEGAFEGDLGL
jgi:2-oxoglutarate dehydrogenase E2 component (dihydrolipoamide succinyltransferase)